MWKVLVGEIEIGRLVPTRTESDTTHGTFTPTESFPRYEKALAPGDISNAEDDHLDAVVDEIAVEGLFLVAEDGSEIVDPELTVDGDAARFVDHSESST